MKRCSISLIIREMQMKTTKYHFIHIRIANMKKEWEITNIAKDAKKLKLLCTIGENVKWHSH